jgi:hypothetical protein
MTPPASSPTATDTPSSPLPASTDIREDLRSYADLGGFTLTPRTHAWYAAVETIQNSEEARAASTVLAELRGRDLPAVRDGATRLAAGTALAEPGTVEETRLAVELSLQVRNTLATLSPAAYDETELDALVAATASRAWRKEQGVKLSWTQRRSLRGRARGLVQGKRARRDALHSALAAAVAARADWAALAPDGGRPELPTDGAFLDDAARAVEAAVTGLRELGRLLRPEQDLATLPFDDLAELLDRLAADEGTLYRLPTLRSLRDRLHEAGLADLLADLTTRRADVTEAVAAYDGPQAEGESVTETEPEQPAAADAVELPGEAAPEAAETPASEAAPEAAEAARTPEETPAEATAESKEAVAETEGTPEPAEAPTAAQTAETAQTAQAPEETPAEATAAAPTEAETAEAAQAAGTAEEESAKAAPEPTEPAEAIAAESPAEVAAEAEGAAETTEVAQAAEGETGTETGTGTETTRPAAKARRPRKPSITPGQPVTAYSARELAALVRWIDSDAVERTDDELLRAAMKELGFARLGPRIKEALGAAVKEVRG